MSTKQVASASLQSIFRFSSPVLARPSQQCPRCFRPFSSASLFQQSSKRRLQTATVYRPETLPTDFHPPRNAGLSESSIAGGVPKIDTWKNSSLGTQLATEQADKSAYSDEPVGASKTSAPSPTAQQQPSTRPRKSKLRPRKAAMVLTPKAVSQLREILDQPEPKLIRVGVKNRGCSGLAYHLEYVDKPGAFDEAVEQDGVKVLIDSKALFSIIGSEMDWVEDKLNQRFVFKNPNITEQCGCGESFSIS